MLVGLSCFVHAEILLNNCGSHDWAFWSFEHAGWNFDQFSHIIFVSDAVEHLLSGGLVEVFSGEFNKLSAVHVGQRDVVVSE